LKPEDTIELERILEEAVGPGVIGSSVKVYKVSRCARAFIRPCDTLDGRSRVPDAIRKIVDEKVRALGGSWDDKHKVWDVPLARR
jgi:hypothetical protein